MQATNLVRGRISPVNYIATINIVESIYLFLGNLTTANYLNALLAGNFNWMSSFFKKFI